MPSWPKVPVSQNYYGYENYIENGLICLKNKVRNLEKKKVRICQGNVTGFKNWTGWGTGTFIVIFFPCPQLKLEGYKKRLSRGHALNRDQMVRGDYAMAMRI